MIICSMISGYFISSVSKYALCLSTLAVSLCFSLPAVGQLKEILKHYSTEDGLSHDGILCMTRDREGFMWFGTWDGLNKFDGSTFSVYKSHSGDSSSLSNNKIRNIVEDRDGYLWIKTYDHSLYRFNKRTERFYAIGQKGDLKNIVVDRIYPLEKGHVWLTSKSQGLLHVVNTSPLADPQIYRYSKSGTGKFKLPSDSVNFLFEDHQKSIWIGTAAGLIRMKQGLANSSPTVYHPELSFTCASRNGNLVYFGTREGQLLIFNLLSGQLTAKELHKGTNINAIHISSGRILYAVTSGHGLIRVDLTTNEVTFTQSSKFNSFFSIHEDRSGRLWLEPQSTGIVKYDPVKNTFKLFTQKKDSHAISPNNNYIVFEDVNGTLWTRLKGGGFGFYNPLEDKIEYFYNEPGGEHHRFSNIVTALYPDSTGILWMATIDGGINTVTFPRNNFNHKLLVKKPNNRSQNEVRVLFEDSKERLWVGTKSGELSVFEQGRKKEQIFDHIPGKRIGNVYSIMEDSGGVIWLGTKGEGLLMAVPTDASGNKYQLTRFLSDARNPYSLSNNTVYSIIQDKRGRIWAGTFGGGLNEVVRNKSRTFFINQRTSFKHYPAASKYIRHLCEDSFGDIWIATTNGLVILNPHKGSRDDFSFVRHTKIPGDKQSLGNNDVQFIYRDQASGMWVGTFGGGLNKRVSPGRSPMVRFRVYTLQDGLSSDIILSMAEDRSGHLWLATESGLSRLDKGGKQFKNYDTYDGLPDTKFSESAAFRSQSGHMFFGCTEGYISFDPTKIANRKVSANMALTNLQLFNNDIVPGVSGSPLSQSLNSTARIKLAYDQNVVNIDYAVLDYRASHKIQYAYILKGYDKDWHHVKNQKKATYTNLPPGDYEFIVKSVNKDLFHNVPQKSIKISILPPPWLTIWAYIAYILIALGVLEMARRIIISMIRLRNKVTIEHKLTELKLQFFTNISHELRTPLTLIVGPLEELSRTESVSEQGKRYISTISRNANRMIRFINQLLDFRKVQSGKMRLAVSEVDVVRLIAEITDYFDGLAREKRINLQLESDVEELYAWVDAEKMDIIIYNLLSNAFKFSPSDTAILVRIIGAGEEGYFTVTVSDQGSGVPPDKLKDIFDLYYEGEHLNPSLKGTGIGLALSAELVHAHKGEITAENNPDGGMTFSLRFRSGNQHFQKDQINRISSEPIPALTDIFHEEEDASLVIADSMAPTELEMPVVLLVEDNVELRKFMAGQLSTFYKVMEAADGAEGLVAAEKSLPDLIISDVMMPGVDGIQMLDHLKHNTLTSHIPVILLTAKSSVESQVEGLRYGADFYITKPFNMRYLIALVANFMKRRNQQLQSLTSDDKKVVSLKPDEILITSKDEEFIKQVIKIIEESMEDSEFNIDSVAESVGFGRTTFYKKLKSLTGLAPVEFVREMRLKRSKQLLDSGEYTISEIAYTTGFKSLGYFSTCFKEKYKLSPSAYLKTLREPNNSSSV
ncbi:two-component regulator propeller domain-containing protein [Arcticibacter sp.]|uniref:hybrid sensor histidine kinase/response regulator transcription factor n=1 Tax=Arcticibacter sp. TaxID=1872630 RepID=UPI0038911826